MEYYARRGRAGVKRYGQRGGYGGTMHPPKKK